jgi:hypothetical protein
MAFGHDSAKENYETSKSRREYMHTTGSFQALLLGSNPATKRRQD